MEEIKDSSVRDVLLESMQVIKALLPHMQDSTANVVRIDERVATLKSGFDKLSRLLYEGNGKPSFVEQFITVGDDLRNLQRSVSELSSRVDDMIDSQEDMDKLKRTNRILVIIALISSLTSIGVAFISHYH